MGVAFETVLNLWAGLLVGCYVVSSVLPVSRSRIALLAAPLVALPILVTNRRIVNWLSGLVLRTFKQFSTNGQTPLNSGMQPWFLSVGMFVATGLSHFLLMRAFYASLSLQHLAGITSAVALSWVAGFLAPWAPSGIGVRDGLLALLLQAYIPTPVVMLVVVASRLLIVFEDVSWALIAILLKW
jgi:hypothetical protein